MQLRWDGDVNPAKLGIMVCGHGSRNRKAVAEFAQLTTGLGRLLPRHPLAYGYLEFAHPVIPSGLDRLRSAGVAQVVAVREQLEIRLLTPDQVVPSRLVMRVHRDELLAVEAALGKTLQLQFTPCTTGLSLE
ncbi:hypothetical protein BO98_01315 [Candidatus Synechococcus spongiarum LMB bulk10D]|nr:hypothetical protein BO98_01315 [Candidatus Synechococcus spongiarum LMB bulk10D]